MLESQVSAFFGVQANFADTERIIHRETGEYVLGLVAESARVLGEDGDFKHDQTRLVFISLKILSIGTYIVYLGGPP